MTQVATWRIGLKCRVFVAKMVRKSMKHRIASVFVVENSSARALMAKTFALLP